MTPILKTTNKLIKEESGSITIEAAIIVPIVIFSIIVIMYISLLLYQQACLQSVANNVASRGAETWGRSITSIETGRVRIDDLNNKGLYWRIFDSDKETQENNVREFLINKSDRFSLLKEIRKTIDIELKDYIVYKKLIVTVQATYNLPVAEFLQVFGLKKDYIVKVESEAVVNDPVEFIRNIDFIVDIERKLEMKYPGLRDLGDKTRNIISGIKEKIHELN